MATFDQIKEVRLTISDPPGFIDLLEVATSGSLPVSPIAQTAYMTTDTGTYYDKSSGAWVAVELLVSDSAISGWIDTFGVDGAVRKAYERIIGTLPSRMQMVKNADGAESTEYQKLLDMLKFYRQRLEDLTPAEVAVNTGRWGKSRSVCVAGGNV